MQEGIKAGQRALILRLLERRIGTVNPDVVSRIGELSVLHKTFKIGTIQECYIVAKGIDAREKLR